MYKKSPTHYVTKIIVDMMFYGGILCVLLIPLIVKYLYSFYSGYETSKIILTVVLYLSGISALYIVFILKQMFKTLLDGNPFIDENIRHFRKMAVACAVISFIYLVKCVIMFTFATAIIAIVFAMGSLFCLTLKDLFKQAINYKNENDLTI